MSTPFDYSLSQTNFSDAGLKISKKKLILEKNSINHENNGYETINILLNMVY